MNRYLCCIVSLLLVETIDAQMAIHSDLYLGPDYELFNAFELTSFHSGIMTIDRNGGLFSFGPDSVWENSDSSSHLDGSIRKYGPSAFTFPTGHGGQYQPLHISQAAGNAQIDVAFVALPHTETELSLELDALHPAFYWSVANSSNQGRLTLSWNVNNDMSSFVGSRPLSDLSIAGLLGGRWQQIPSLVDTNSLIDFSPSDLLSGSISSESSFNLGDYSAFTIGLKKGGTTATTDMSVREGVTPNNDGVNDEWVIEGIEAYPSAQVYVYNRLGKLVFSALSGYDNSWTGNFGGNLDPLPVGPYYYTVDLEADGQIDLQGWIYINY